MIYEHQYRSDEPGGPCTYRWSHADGKMCGRPRAHHEEVDYKTRQADEQKLSNQLWNGPAKAAYEAYWTVMYSDVSGEGAWDAQSHETQECWRKIAKAAVNAHTAEKDIEDFPNWSNGPRPS
jgi:hypothetical protein